MAQKFPLRDCIVQQRCIMEAESFAGKQVSHRRNAAGRVRRGRVTVIHSTIGIEGVLILETRAIAVWNGFQTALHRSSASESQPRSHGANWKHAPAKDNRNIPRLSDATQTTAAEREENRWQKRRGTCLKLQTTCQSTFSIDFPVGEAKEKQRLTRHLGNISIAGRRVTDWDVESIGYSSDRELCRSTPRRSGDRCTSAFVLQFY